MPRPLSAHVGTIEERKNGAKGPCFFRGASLPAYRTALPKPQSFVILLLQEIGRTALPDGASNII